LTLIVFLLLGPPVGLATFLAVSSLGAVWNDTSDAVPFLTLKVLAIRPDAVISLTYLLGAPAAGLAGVIVARIRQTRPKLEGGWVVLVGLGVGAVLVLTCGMFGSGTLLEAVAVFAGA